MARRSILGGALVAVAMAAVLCLSTLAIHYQLARGSGGAVALLNLRLHPAASYFIQSLSHLSHSAHEDMEEGMKTRKDAQRWDSSMIGAFKTFQSLSKVTNENLAGKLHPTLSKDAPLHVKHDRKKQESLASLHNQFEPEHFKDPAWLSDGIPNDMFASTKSRTTQLSAASLDAPRHDPTRARGDMIVENHNGIPELHLRNSPSPGSAAPAQHMQISSHQQHLAAAPLPPPQVAPLPAVPQQQIAPAPRHGGRRVRRIVAAPSLGQQTESEEGAGVGAVDEDENADAMTTLQNAMSDAAQASPGHVEKVRTQSPSDPMAEQQPFESYFAYKYRMAHGGGFPE